MKTLVFFLAISWFATVAHADSFVAERPYTALAQILQQRLPEVASDRLFEAKRSDGGMEYVFRTKAEKTWVEEVRIYLRQKSVTSSDVRVEVVRMDGGLVKTTEKREPLEASEWTARIREFLTK